MEEEQQMKVKARDRQGVVVLDLEGNIDINASNIVEAVGWVIKNKSAYVVLNFSQVNMVDYIGISVIAVAYKNILNHKGKMEICAVPQHLRNLFTVVGLSRVFTFFETEDEAVNNLRADDKIAEILKKKLRRRFKRIPYYSKIEYREKGSTSSPYYQGKIINLSAIGLFAIAKKIYPVDQILSTRIFISDSSSVMEVDTKVVWVADHQIQPREYPGMGLEFYEIDSQQQETIVNFVNRHFSGSECE